jgi:hypothetical protein
VHRLLQEPANGLPIHPSREHEAKRLAEREVELAHAEIRDMVDSPEPLISALLLEIECQRRPVIVPEYAGFGVSGAIALVCDLVCLLDNGRPDLDLDARPLERARVHQPLAKLRASCLGPRVSFSWNARA